MPTITVDGTDVVVTSLPGEPVLTALARHGYAHRTGCRRGGCGICKIELRSGEVDYPVRVADSVLTPEDHEAGLCLSCRAVPVTDVVVHMHDDDKLRCVAPLLALLAGVSR
jgi:CDP-4-dehydro-6-deoxyglucose reductase